MKRLFVPQYQNSDVKKVNWRPPEPHFVMQIFAFLPNILAPPPHAPLAILAVSSVSELSLETWVNVFGRDVLLAARQNDDDPLVVPFRRMKNWKRTDLATIILNVLLM
jgi:hypothetical protein